MADSRDDEIRRLTDELAKAHADLQMVRLVLARTTVELAQEKARNRVMQAAIEKLI